MKINKIKDKLDFDVETQENDKEERDCMHDCPIKGNVPHVTGLTWGNIVGQDGLNNCHVEVRKGIIGYGPILSEWR
ncbi:MAG: hypothetical protein IKH28_07785 [Lachnospiraceae bacterium]|nr:hypothetical protein [Lachnospiraceae bacterium]